MGIQFIGGLKIIPNQRNGLGNYYLYSEYSPAIEPGSITFPDHQNQVGSLNPNEIGQTGGGTLTQIYINPQDSEENDNSTYLQQLIGNNTRLTLTQGSNFIVLECNEFAFTNAIQENFYSDNSQGGALIGSITIVTPASGNFNTIDPILINIVVLSPSSTPTPTPVPPTATPVSTSTPTPTVVTTSTPTPTPTPTSVLPTPTPTPTLSSPDCDITCNIVTVPNCDITYNVVTI